MPKTLLSFMPFPIQNLPATPERGMATVGLVMSPAQEVRATAEAVRATAHPVMATNISGMATAQPVTATEHKGIAPHQVVRATGQPLPRKKHFIQHFIYKPLYPINKNQLLT
jgi:hypothetical protein